jgi:hypothetical protein
MLILGVKSNSTVSGEVGPLHCRTSRCIVWVELLLDIIINFVFDPLAIALILVTNRIF